MSHFFDVTVNTEEILMVSFKSPELGERKFSLETFELFVKQLPTNPTNGYTFEINEKQIEMNEGQYAQFRLNCSNLLIATKKAVHITLSIKHNCR